MTSAVRARTLAACLVLACACAGGGNRAPGVEPVGRLDVTVGDTLVRDLHAVDPDGDPVAFAMRGAPDGARLEPVGGAWRFVYSPLASDAKPGGARYDLAFTASDGRGGRTEAPAVLWVHPEGEVPAFLGPFAWTLNLAEADHLAVRIRVRDDDDATLALTLKQGIEGAVFEVIDGHTAQLYFKPKPAQVTGSPIYTFRVGAADKVHEEVTADFAVVLINPDLFGGCPGTPPVADHVPPGDQRTAGGYALALDARDAESRVREATLLWSAVRDAAEKDMNRVALAPGDDGVWTGRIPDLSAAAEGGRLVYYHFVATDADDPASDACDHATRLPKAGELAFAVYPPGTPEATCLEDGIAGNHDEAGAVALPEGRVAGLRLCGGLPDVFRVDVAAGEAVAVRATSMAGGPDPRVRILDDGGAVLASGSPGTTATAGVDGSCLVRVEPPGGGAVTYVLEAASGIAPCPPDGHEPDGSPGEAGPLPAGTTRATLCPADVDWYAFDLDAGQAAALSASFDPEAVDVDLAVYEAGQAVPVRVSNGAHGLEQVVIDTDVPRSFLVRVDAPGLGTGDYQLDLRVEGQAVLCEDDLMAPNATADEATTVPEGLWEHLKLCPGKADWVRTVVNGGETVSVYVEVEAGREAPALALVADDGAELATGDVAGEVSAVEWAATGPGPVRIRIGPAGDVAVPYTLRFDVEDPPGGCRPDRLEPDDTPETAVSLPAGITPHLTACAGDVDVFGFRLEPLEALTVELLAGSVSVRGSIRGADGTELAAGEPSAWGEHLFYLADERRTVYLEVRPDGGDGWYDVAVEK